MEKFFVKCANDSLTISESDFKDLETKLLNYQIIKEARFEGNNQVKIATIVISPSSLLKLYFEAQ